MALVRFRVVTKTGLKAESTTKRGRISDAGIENVMKAAFHLYHGTTLNDLVQSFENNRCPKGFYGTLKPTRFFDAERREQGLWYGTADCFVIAAEELSEEVTAFISRTIAQNGEAK